MSRESHPRRLRVLALAAAVASALCAPLAAQEEGTTWAVVVGINDYIEFDNETGDLRGAENDALGFHAILLDKMAVPPDHVRLLLNREATRTAIREALTEWLRPRARAGDRAIFFFAGHGSQALDEDGDEADGLDETLAAADALFTSSVNDVLDDEVNEWLLDLEAAEIIVILDSCSSGTATRLGGMYARPRRLDRSVVTPVPAGEPGEFAMLDETGAVGRIVELAAAGPGQAAMDAAFLAEDGSIGFYGGAFTTHLVRALWAAPRGATFREAFRTARSALKADRFAQDPQYTAALDLALFPAASPSVDAVEVLAVTDAGAARLTSGPPGTLGENVLLRTEAGGLVRVTRVHAEDAVGRVVREPVRVGDRLTPAGQVLADAVLRVATGGLAAQDLATLRASVAGADAIVWLGPAEIALADIVVARGPDDDLLTFGRDGLAREAPPPSPGDDPLAWLARRLEWELAVQDLSSLASASTRYGVSVGLDDEEGTYQEGEPIQISVESELEGYLTLLEIGQTGAVQVILPNEFSGSVRIRARAPITVPGPLAPFRFDASPPFGVGFIEAIVTPEPLDLAGIQGAAAAWDPVQVARAVRTQVGRQARARGMDASLVGASEEILGERPWAAGIVSYEVRGPA